VVGKLVEITFYYPTDVVPLIVTSARSDVEVHKGGDKNPWYDSRILKKKKKTRQEMQRNKISTRSIVKGGYGEKDPMPSRAPSLHVFLCTIEYVQ
jgi:hypothetical protein